MIRSALATMHDEQLRSELFPTHSHFASLARRRLDDHPLALLPLLGALGLTLAGCSGLRQPAAPLASPVVLGRSCESMNGMEIPPARIGLPTQGAVVTSAERAPAVAPYRDPEGEYLLPTPERCLVQGRIKPVDASAPPIRFAINLPLSNWNGRALQSGGGGLGGQLITAPGSKASGRFDPNPLNVPYPVTQGYATFGSDNGHPSGHRQRRVHRQRRGRSATGATRNSRRRATRRSRSSRPPTDAGRHTCSSVASRPADVRRSRRRRSIRTTTTASSPRRR
jgi:hypothetical protein